jgi:hypothetical protein
MTQPYEPEAIEAEAVLERSRNTAGHRSGRERRGRARSANGDNVVLRDSGTSDDADPLEAVLIDGRVKRGGALTSGHILSGGEHFRRVKPDFHVRVPPL